MLNEGEHYYIQTLLISDNGTMKNKTTEHMLPFRDTTLICSF